MKKIAVKFIRSCAPYNTGEIAGFPQLKAVDYVLKGYAKLYVKNEIEIPAEEIVSDEPEELVTNPENTLIAASLQGTKQEILESILETDENGDPVINDTMLGDMLFYERQAKNRKNVIKAIEDVSFDRIRAR